MPVASLLEDDPDTTGLTAPGVELRDLRRSAGLTQRHIAEITGTTRQNVANLERRGGALRIDWLIELAKMTGRHPWSLVDPEMIELSPEERKLILRLRR